MARMTRCPSTTRAIRRYLADAGMQRQLRSHAAALRLIEILDRARKPDIAPDWRKERWHD